MKIERSFANALDDKKRKQIANCNLKTAYCRCLLPLSHHKKLSDICSMKKWVFVFALYFVNTFCKAQSFYSPCIDPAKYVNIFYPCYSLYEPVCGCDGNTYRSPCTAVNQYALNAGNYVDGPCADFHYVIEPNLVQYTLPVRMYKKTSGYVKIAIFDLYGKLYYQSSISIPIGRSDKEINDISSYLPGIYFIEIITDEVRQVTKFMIAQRE